MPAMLVTGGAGFIGANFVRLALRETDWRVAVLDKLTYAGNLASLEDVLDNPRFAFIQGDIADRQTVEAAFAAHEPDWIVNFAAESHVDRSIDDPAPFVQTNVVGTFEMLEAARRRHAALRGEARERFRFLHVSTDEVYGSLGESGAFSETTPYDPRSPYSATKAGADHLARAWFETFALPVIVTNCSNNFGPYQYPEKLIPLCLLNMLEARDIPIYGDGGNVRDWLYVEDHCEGILLALRRGRPGQKYNIGGAGERTNLQVVDSLCLALEALAPAAKNPAMRSRGAASYLELKTFVADRPGHDRRYAIDASKIKRELGWAARHDFDSALRHTVRFYLDHPEWREAVQAGKNARERIGTLKSR